MMRNARWLLVSCLLGSVACATILGIEDATPRDGGLSGDASCDGAGCVASCAAATLTDPKNCGRCDHDCLGGRCEDGTCTPGVLLEATRLTPSGRSFTGDVRLAEGKVLWTDRENLSTFLRACALEHCEPQDLAVQLARVPPVARSAVYFSAGKAIDTVALDGGLASRANVRDFAAADQKVDVVGTDAVAGAIFYDVVGDGLNHELRSCSVPGCPVDTALTTIDGGPEGWTYAFADDLYVYASWRRGPGLTRCPKGGCKGMPTFLGSLVAPMAVGDKKLVGTRSGRRVLVACTLPECSVERDVHDEPDTVTSVAPDGVFLYWSNGARVISRCSIDDCGTPEVLYRGEACDAGCGDLALALANGVLVWAEPDRIYRLVLP